MTTPNGLQQLLYFGGKRAPAEHRDWIATALAETSSKRLAFRLALPNACIMALLPIVALANGNLRRAALFAGGIVIATVASAFVPWIQRRRVAYVRQRQSL